MCLNPISILNPNFGQGKLGLNYLHNTIDKYIQVPCGHCKQCVATRQSYFLQRYDLESMVSELFFFTLTYAPEALPYGTFDFQDGTKTVPCFKISDVQNMFKRIRKYCPFPFSYVYVSEYGSRKHRPHYHGVIAVKKSICNDIFKIRQVEDYLFITILKEWRRNIGSTRVPRYVPLCRYVHTRFGYNYDLHYIRPVVSGETAVPYYVSKYLFKYDRYANSLIYSLSEAYNEDVELKRKVINNIKPRLFMSKSFGRPDAEEQQQHIIDCIDRSFAVNPTINPQYRYHLDQKTFALSPNYRKKFLTLEQRLRIYEATQHEKYSSSVLNPLSYSEQENIYRSGLSSKEELRKTQEFLNNKYR